MTQSNEPNAPKNDAPGDPTAHIFTFKRQCPIILFSIIMLIVAALIYVPSEINPIDFDLPEPVSLIDKLAANNYLNLSKKVYERQVLGPESLVFYKDKIYTGTHDGNIMQLYDGKAEVYAKLGPKNCSSVIVCGRPLGMRLDPFHPRLIIADTYFGLYAVSLEDPANITRLFPTKDYGINFKVSFFNDVEILRDGVFAVSESSVSSPYHKLINTVLEGTSTGRVYLIDTNKKSIEILAENLAFPNGVQLLQDKRTLIVAETMRNRVLTIDTKTKKVGYFTDKIPGMPDNIRPSPRGGYWIGIASASTLQSPNLFYRLRHWPWVRWAVHKLVPAGLIHSLSLSKHVITVRVNENAVIEESLQGFSVSGLSTVEVLELNNGTMYFSSYYLPHLRRLERSQIAS